MRLVNILAALLGALALTACVSAGRPAKGDAQRKSHAKALTIAEVTDDEPTPAPMDREGPGGKVPDKRAAKGAAKGANTGASQAKPSSQAAAAPAGPSPEDIQSCRTLVSRYSPPYRALYRLLPPGSYAPTGTTLEQLVQAQPEACSQVGQRATLVAAIADAVTAHGGRIGVILPLSGQSAKLATYLVSGLRAAFQEAGANFDTAAVLKDSGGMANAAEAGLAELIFKDRVALVIGGFGKAEAESLAKWSNDLTVPVLLLNRDRDVVTPSRFAFMLYPDEKRLADTLADAAAHRHLQRVALLRPASGKSDKVSEYFKNALKAKGGQVNYEVAYTPGNFESMEGAARQLFKTDLATRAGEYRAAYLKAKKQAEKTGVAFDPRMVLLKPIVDFDAVFIPDDFRTVRHFAKLFKFHMVDHLPLIGNHEWRSPALIDPFDDFLDGSLFADFIGSYAKLPASISAPTLSSPFFINPERVVAVDFQLIGYRAGRVAQSATTKPPPRRQQLPAVLLGLTGDGIGFPKGPVFDAGRHGNWPTYVFTVARQRLNLESLTASAGPLANVVSE